MAPDWNPASTTSWSFSLYFSSYYSRSVWLQPFETFTWNAGLTLNSSPNANVFVCPRLSVAFFECFFCIWLFRVCFVLFFFLRDKHPDGFSLQRCSSIHGQYCRNELSVQCLPPSVVMSQNTFKELPFFSGLIQYSPSPLESPASKMCLQDSAGWREDQPGIAANLNMYYSLTLWFRVNCQIISNVLTGITRLIVI